MDEAIPDDDSYDSSILLPDSILNFSPSQKDKIDQTEELLYRVYGCELIQEAGILLKLPQVVMATGQNIFHRFFYRKSLERFDSFTVAMGSVLLASKIEEKLKYLRDIIFVFHHIYQRRKGLKLKPLELGGVRYTEWKGELITMERYLLKELGFSFYNILDHPHKYILYYVKMLDGTSELSQSAWNYLNDSLRLDLSLRYPAEEIACAAIYMAARKCGFSLPDNPPWWSLMMSDKNKLLLICDRVLELYHMPKLLWLEPIADVPYLSAEVCRKYDELAEPSTSQPMNVHLREFRKRLVAIISKMEIEQRFEFENKGVREQIDPYLVDLAEYFSTV